MGFSGESGCVAFILVSFAAYFCLLETVAWAGHVSTLHAARMCT